MGAQRFWLAVSISEKILISLVQQSENSSLTQEVHPRFSAWERYTHIYAIVDAAQDEGIYKTLMGCTEEFTCLFNGRIPVVLARAAPYLIKLPVESELFQKFYQQGFYNNWAIFFTSFDSGKDLKKHFQDLLRVKTEDGRRLYFRYYDPRVLRTYLPTCTPSELRTVFGSASKFWVCGEEKDTIIEYGKDDERFYVTTFDLKSDLESSKE